ncbi:unnamed protein product [Dicrocoelium dendriticum]|nr:unnamed protein product [Dicrocoelium dendriticum]
MVPVSKDIEAISRLPRLWHSGLTKLQYSTFFQICRSQYIGFNLKDRSGVLLCPMDSCRREYLGMIAISETLEKAIKMFGETLKALHYEISSPKTLTGNNFQADEDLGSKVKHIPHQLS